MNETKDWQYDVTIQDTRTSALPTTGSVGTVLFAVLGIALMAGAVWLYAVASASPPSKRLITENRKEGSTV